MIGSLGTQRLLQTFGRSSLAFTHLPLTACNRVTMNGQKSIRSFFAKRPVSGTSEGGSSKQQHAAAQVDATASPTKPLATPSPTRRKRARISILPESTALQMSAKVEGTVQGVAVPPAPFAEAAATPVQASTTQGSVEEGDTGAATVNPDAAAATAAAAGMRGWREMRADAERCTALARQAVTAANKQGSQPQLSDLLTENSWKSVLATEMRKPYFSSLQSFVEGEWKGSKPIHPPKDCVFRALNSCALSDVRVVILGQDPYHSPNTAMGLCFSVAKGNRVPPSLNNIYKELKEDLGCDIPRHGDLSKWSYQGVLLLNTVLTVRGGEANSHKKKGWEEFTSAVIKELCRQRPGLVFLLWGKPAQEKERLVLSSPHKHHVLKAPHPSPLAAASGASFVGCRHFSQVNALLKAQGLPEVDWQIEP